jgi:hypothetical protein
MYSHFITVFKFASLYIMILSENKNYIIEKDQLIYFNNFVL